MSGDIILVIVVLTALAFDFTNGFHDTANVVATAISTHAIPPKPGIAAASLLNFAGAFISLKVAATVGKGFVDTHAVTTTVVFAGLVGAIAWNLITWYFGLPSSSSHALIGGRLRPGPVGRGFRLGQLASSALLALSHGTNDAQKTMGVITLALVAHGNISASSFHVPIWVVIASASAISLGTFTGGWRIIRTMGSRIIKMDAAQGFAAQAAGAAVILAASSVGYPLSTTHVISGGIMGAGAGKRFSAVRWGVAGNIVSGWVLTLPAAALFGAVVYELSRTIGHGDAGPLVITIALVVALAATFARRALQSPATPVAS
jgi:PiT family inorganic phosphate transporter